LIGAQKCGTTSLAKQLKEQYGVSTGLGFEDGAGFSNRKEPHFFNTDTRYERGLEHYASIFPPCGQDVLTMDATPDYLFGNVSLGRIARMYGPERLERTTFAALLCEPLQRTQSAFYHMRSREVAGFDRPSSATFPDFVGETSQTALATWAHGRYGPQLDRILDELGQVAIIPTAWYLTSAQPTLKELLDLVERRSGKRVPAPAHTSNAKPLHAFAGSHLPLAEELPSPVLADLAEALFRSSNEHVYELAYSDDPRVSLLPAVLHRPYRFLDLDAIAVGTELVSIVTLVTAERAGYLELVLEQIRRQTYPRLEVIVIDDVDDDDDSSDLADGPSGAVAQALAAFVDLQIIYRRALGGSTVGQKRNLACSVANGEVIVTWDADDLYSDARVAVQVVPILNGKYDVSIFRFRFFAWASPTAIEYYETPGEEQSPSMGTLAFRRSLWVNGAKYPEVDVGEDVGFLNSAIQECACSTILPGDEGIYVRHVGGGNTWNWRNESVGKGTTGRSMIRIPRPSFLSNATDTRCMKAESALVARAEAKQRQKYRGSRRNLVMIPWHDFKATFSLLPARCLESTSTARDSCPVEHKQRELRRLLVDSAGPPPMALTPPPPPPQFDIDAIRAAVMSSLYATGVTITASQLTLEDVGGTSVKVTIVQLETGPTAKEVTTAAQEPLFLEYMSGIACGFSQSPVTTVITITAPAVSSTARLRRLEPVATCAKGSYGYTIEAGGYTFVGEVSNPCDVDWVVLVVQPLSTTTPAQRLLSPVSGIDVSDAIASTTGDRFLTPTPPVVHSSHADPNPTAHTPHRSDH